MNVQEQPVQSFKVLGQTVRGWLTAEDLEAFETPPGITEVSFHTEELNAMCPVTDQPDLYTADITYGPKDRVVESKTLKLYLNGFRNVGIFGETLASVIATDLQRALDAYFVHVILVQQVRGGLRMTVKADAYADILPGKEPTE